MERTGKALLNHKSGFNCAQAVTCAYAGVFGIDEKTAFRVTEGFGLGMGAMDTCGAVTAMAVVTGMKESDGNMSAPATKNICYKKAKKMLGEFKAKNGSLICRELKGVDTGKPLRSCEGCIEDAIAIIDENLFP
jgi:C_GCAxxG_C_C family probable redox protein